MTIGEPLLARHFHSLTKTRLTTWRAVDSKLKEAPTGAAEAILRRRGEREKVGVKRRNRHSPQAF